MEKHGKNFKLVCSPHIKLTTQFSEALQPQVEEMAKILKHPKQIECKPEKFIVFEKGGHFSSFDYLTHSPNLVFTLAIEIFVTPKNKGGVLTIDDQEDIPFSLNENELILTLFYHDTPFKVSEVTNGIRVFLFFDVVETENVQRSVFEKFEPDFLNAVRLLQAKGVSKIGILANHSYLTKGRETLCLKGIDALFAQLVKKYSKVFTIIRFFLKKIRILAKFYFFLNFIGSQQDGSLLL